MSGYEGAVEQASSGQWTWWISSGGVELMRAGGYASEGEAIDDLHESLADLAGDGLVLL